ncbi:hypothetical protein PR202_gb23887 [Eleusine coracana subsp. coracana]|uniref:Uncharacterized protein n=1 Tax=Eleusine coracana subsp. coracana TaxID=191504 RepID=A0AAV5FHD2_ELECO|nr:hypothetical protein PR202_gb23887 [Eleusine coracana subsp. coracana]
MLDVLRDLVFLAGRRWLSTRISGAPAAAAAAIQAVHAAPTPPPMQDAPAFRRHLPYHADGNRPPQAAPPPPLGPSSLEPTSPDHRSSHHNGNGRPTDATSSDCADPHHQAIANRTPRPV